MAQDLKDQLASLKIDRSGSDDEPGGRGRTWIWIGLAILVVAALAFFFLRPRATPVKTALAAEAASGSGPAAVLNASGYVTARRQATVSSKITGKVAEIFVEEGMKVEADQILARLDDRQARLELELAQAQLGAAEKALAETEANLNLAKKDLERNRQLTAVGVSSQAALDTAEAQATSLEARLQRQKGDAEVTRRNVAILRQLLDDTIIRAPFAGVAISKDAQPGEMVSPVSAGGGFTRTGISTIVDMASLEIEVDVNEAYLQRVTSGQKVRATLDAYPEEPFAAHLITVIPAADRDKATVKVRIGFDQLDPRILPDMAVKVAFLADTPAAGAAGAAGGGSRAVRVPRSAIRDDASGKIVFVVGPDGLLERRAVGVALGTGDTAEVTAGLRAGERVVIEGPATLVAGMKVKEAATE
ncbi:MAG: efflux RND transporter periplasmic adaptor subunit [Thermoanaerobaculia bacterium]